MTSNDVGKNSGFYKKGKEMKLVKIGFATLLSMAVIGSAFAFGPLKKIEGDDIHTDVISLPAGKIGINVISKMSVGQYENGTCIIKKTFVDSDPEPYGNGDTVSIGGADLKRYLGSGYTCAQEQYIDIENNQSTQVMFQLTSDEQGNYTGSIPLMSNVTLK